MNIKKQNGGFSQNLQAVFSKNFRPGVYQKYPLFPLPDISDKIIFKCRIIPFLIIFYKIKFFL